MPIGFKDRGCSLAEVMKVTQLVWDAGKDLCDGLANGLLAIRDHRRDRHLQGIPHLLQQGRQIVLGGRQQAAHEQEFARERVAQHPQDFVADIRLQPIQGQDDALVRIGQTVRSLMGRCRARSKACISGTLRCSR